MLRCVGDKVVNAEARATLCDGEEPAYEKQNEIRTERERESEAQRINYIPIATITTMTTTTTTFTKVTRSLYIVTNLGQLPFMLFT